MASSQKRKRGRPRLEESKEIIDFDRNLILEFRSCPVFYDRNHPQHRNRIYIERQWQTIAQNLNVSTSSVKNRILQLRNRYNLEKRRLDTLQEETNENVQSPWSLYELLTFLNEYVKPRNKYPVPANFPSKFDNTSTSDVEEEEEEEDEDQDGDNGHTQRNVQDEDELIDVDKPGDANGQVFNNTQRANLMNGHPIPHNTTNNDSGILCSRNASNATANHYRVAHNSSRNSPPSVDKYKAFGQFLASSLMEMNETQALNLVEKFTSDLVKSLKDEERNRTLRSIYHNGVGGVGIAGGGGPDESEASNQF